MDIPSQQTMHGGEFCRYMSPTSPLLRMQAAGEGALPIEKRGSLPTASTDSLVPISAQEGALSESSPSCARRESSPSCAPGDGAAQLPEDPLEAAEICSIATAGSEEAIDELPMRHPSELGYAYEEGMDIAPAINTGGGFGFNQAVAWNGENAWDGAGYWGVMPVMVPCWYPYNMAEGHYGMPPLEKKARSQGYKQQRQHGGKRNNFRHDGHSRFEEWSTSPPKPRSHKKYHEQAHAREERHSPKQQPSKDVHEQEQTREHLSLEEVARHSDAEEPDCTFLDEGAFPALAPRSPKRDEPRPAQNSDRSVWPRWPATQEARSKVQDGLTNSLVAEIDADQSKREAHAGNLCIAKDEVVAPQPPPSSEIESAVDSSWCNEDFPSSLPTLCKGDTSTESLCTKVIASKLLKPLLPPEPEEPPPEVEEPPPEKKHRRKLPPPPTCAPPLIPLGGEPEGEPSDCQSVQSGYKSPPVRDGGAQLNLRDSHATVLVPDPHSGTPMDSSDSGEEDTVRQDVTVPVQRVKLAAKPQVSAPLNSRDVSASFPSKDVVKASGSQKTASRPERRAHTKTAKSASAPIPTATTSPASKAKPKAETIVSEVRSSNVQERLPTERKSSFLAGRTVGMFMVFVSIIVGVVFTWPASTAETEARMGIPGESHASAMVDPHESTSLQATTRGDRSVSAAETWLMVEVARANAVAGQIRQTAAQRKWQHKQQHQQRLAENEQQRLEYQQIAASMETRTLRPD